MIQSIDTTLYTSSTVAAASVNSVTTAQAVAADTESTAAATSSKTDVVEISKEGREALRQSKILASTAQTKSTGSDSAAAVKVKSQDTTSAALKSLSTGSSESETETTSTTSSATNTSDLSSYTEYQLSKMVSEGTITQKQADNELARRAKSKENETDASNTSSEQVTKSSYQKEVEAYKKVQALLTSDASLLETTVSNSFLSIA